MASQVLELQRFELEQAIQQELTDNPALERLDPQSDALDSDEIIESLTNIRTKVQIEDFDAHWKKGHDPDSESNWVDFVAAPVSLNDHLMAQLLPIVKPDKQRLARHVVECVSSNGYLSLPIEEIANLAGADFEETLEVLKLLQTCEPAGVGAHDLRECLILQLRDADSDIAVLARNIVEHFWEDLIARRVNGIVRRFHVAPALVEHAFAHIAKLTPYPGEQFAATSPCHRPEPIGSVSPDIVFKHDSTGWHIEIRGCDPGDFSINDWYKQKYRDAKKSLQSNNDDEGKHVTTFVKRAIGFIQAIHQRRITMRKIAAYLLQEQSGFIATGSVHFLEAMTRVQLAKATGMHESTVSRATMGKFVQIANGEVVPFETFFKPALRVHKLIEEILLNENPNRPLSDRAIAEMLKARGVEVARRTVNKYREQIRHLSSHQRRTA